MFDSVMVPCPDCGEKNEFQSKGGECLLRTFELADAPADVLEDVNRHSPVTCQKCGGEYSVSLSAMVAIEVIDKLFPPDELPAWAGILGSAGDGALRKIRAERIEWLTNRLKDSYGL